MEKINMESVVLTVEAVNAWHGMAGQVAQAIREAGLRPEQIPDEEIWLKDDKETLVVRCQVGSMLVSMDIPAGHWSWAN